jgi:ubiquinone/menaquinone biosynthesis C-methylase UbiE
LGCFYLLSPAQFICYPETNMTLKDPYSAIKGTLPLLDLMHRFLLPWVSRDMAALMKHYGVNRVLDVACGTGYTVCELHRNGIGIVGVDLSAEMLSVAALKTGGCGFVRADGTSLPFPKGSFDGAIVSLALHEMFPATREAVWSEMKRVVKPGGRLFVLDFARLPGQRSLYSRVVARAILKVERSTLKFDPDHWHNSMLFQEEGGLTGWLEKAGDEPARTRAYLGGNLVLAVITKDNV